MWASMLLRVGYKNTGEPDWLLLRKVGWGSWKRLVQCCWGVWLLSVCLSYSQDCHTYVSYANETWNYWYTLPLWYLSWFLLEPQPVPSTSPPFTTSLTAKEVPWDAGVFSGSKKHPISVAQSSGGTPCVYLTAEIVFLIAELCRPSQQL